MSKEKKFFITFAVVTLLIYGQSLFGGFVFDDRGIIEHQDLLSHVQNIVQVSFYPYWTTDAGLYRPTSLVSYLLNLSLFGLGAFSFHFINLFLYFGIAVGIYLLLKNLFKDEWFAFLAALIFLVLPIHTEVVANITGRLELLALFFSLLALIEFSKEKVTWWAGLWILLAIGAKETAIATVPLALLLLFFREKKVSIELWKKYREGIYALAAGVVAYFFLRFLVLGTDHFLGVETSIIENPLLFTSASSRVVTALSIFWMYISKTFWPFNLCSDYSYNQIPAFDSFLHPAVILGALVLLSSFISIFVFIKRKPIISFASATLFCSFLPVSNIFFPIGTIAGERLFFFPSLGIALLLALLLSKRKAFIYVIIPVIALYGFLTFERQSVWLSEESLFLNAAQCAPQSALSLSNAGTVYYFQGDYVTAAKYLEESKAIKPVYSKGLNNLGLVYWKAGRYKDAEQMYFASLLQKYPYPGVLENLVLLYLSEGEKEKALHWLRVMYPNNDDEIQQFLNQYK